MCVCVLRLLPHSRGRVCLTQQEGLRVGGGFALPRLLMPRGDDVAFDIPLLLRHTHTANRHRTHTDSLAGTQAPTSAGQYDYVYRQMERSLLYIFFILFLLQ